jgi:hypothetical protein
MPIFGVRQETEPRTERESHQGLTVSVEERHEIWLAPFLRQIDRRSDSPRQSVCRL